MSDPNRVIDYWFAENVVEAEFSAQAQKSGGQQVSGPGIIDDIIANGALAFDGQSSVAIDAAREAFPQSIFHVRLIVRVDAPVTDRQNLFEAGRPSCSVHILPPDGRGDFRIAATDNARNGWRGIDSGRKLDLRAGQWLMIELAYDQDTLLLLVDGKMAGVAAFPQGALTNAGPKALWFGMHPSGNLFGLKGAMVHARINRAIPDTLQQTLVAQRTGAEWQISRKENELLTTVPLVRSGQLGWLGGMYCQRYNVGLIAASGVHSSAFYIYGDILAHWDGLPDKDELGVLLSDEQDGRLPGSRRNAFANGTINWSVETGAWSITGVMSLTYESLGGSVSVLGLPTGETAAISGGLMQPFQRGHLYWREGEVRAYAVIGAILEHFLAIGGVDSWGLPVSDETDVLRESDPADRSPTGARRQEFERCLIIWSAATGAHEVHGAIATAYWAAGGPGLPRDDTRAGLGLPISDEMDFTADVGPGKYSIFEHGAILFADGAATIVPTFRLKLGLVVTEEDEGLGQGQNDLYFRIFLKRNGETVYDARNPREGAYDGDNSHDLDFVLPADFTPTPDLVVDLRVEVWEKDGGLGFDNNWLGTLNRRLHLGNGWGLIEEPTGLFADVSFEKVKRFEWQVRPDSPPNMPLDFWNTGNQQTPTLTYEQYAATFADIDDDRDSSDSGDEEKLFAKVIQKAADDGNCFGICATALETWHGRGVGLPLARFELADWEDVRSMINLRQISWFGADVQSFATGNRAMVISPVRVFIETRARHTQMQKTVIAIWEGSNFDKAGHAVIPISWNDTVTPWTIDVYDPNNRNVIQQISIDPSNNSYSFLPLNMSGAIEYIPWSCVDHQQNSLLSDEMLAANSMSVIAVGSTGKTISMTDDEKDNLWLPDNPFGRQRKYSDELVSRETKDRRVIDPSRKGQFIPLGALGGSLNGEIIVRRTLSRGRGKRVEQSDEELAGGDLPRQSMQLGPDFVHRLEGVEDGQLDYLLCWPLNRTLLKTVIARDDQYEISVHGMDLMTHKVALRGNLASPVTFEHVVRIGRTAEFLRVRIPDLIASDEGLFLSMTADLGAIDLQYQDQGRPLTVEVERWRGDVARTTQRFEVKQAATRALRISPTLALSSGLLRVYGLETLEGAVLSVDDYGQVTS